MKNKYINNGFNPKITHGKDLKNPSTRQILRARKRLIKTIQLISLSKVVKEFYK